MTNKEAIEILSRQRPCKSGLEWSEAIDLAISALERDGTLPYDEDTTSAVSCPVCGAIWRNK